MTIDKHCHWTFGMECVGPFVLEVCWSDLDPLMRQPSHLHLRTSEDVGNIDQSNALGSIGVGRKRNFTFCTLTYNVFIVDWLCLLKTVVKGWRCQGHSWHQNVCWRSIDHCWILWARRTIQIAFAAKSSIAFAEKFSLVLVLKGGVGAVMTCWGPGWTVCRWTRWGSTSRPQIPDWLLSHPECLEQTIL